MSKADTEDPLAEDPTEHAGYGGDYDSITGLLNAFEPGDRIHLVRVGRSRKVISYTVEDVIENWGDDGETLIAAGGYGIVYDPADMDAGPFDPELYRSQNDAYHEDLTMSFNGAERTPASALDEDWHEWEVHLCMNLSHESSDDEVLFPEARTEEAAVAKARRWSQNNAPETGPVYDEGSYRR